MKAIKYKVGSINMFDYAANEKEKSITPALCGTYHDGNYKVSCDGKILLAVKDEYATCKEGKILMRDGSYVGELKYPSWRKIIPSEQPNFNPDEWKPSSIKAAAFDTWVRNNREVQKEVYGKSEIWSNGWHVYIGGAFLDAKQYNKFCKATAMLGTDIIWTKPGSNYCAAYAMTDKGYVLLQTLHTEMVERELEEDSCDILDLT